MKVKDIEFKPNTKCVECNEWYFGEDGERLGGGLAYRSVEKLKEESADEYVYKIIYKEDIPGEVCVVYGNKAN